VPAPKIFRADVSRAYFFALARNLRRLGRLEEAQKALANSQRYREAKIFVTTYSTFSDEPVAAADGDSHTSDRIAACSNPAPTISKIAEAMVQGGVQENPAAQPSSAPQTAAGIQASKEYRAFASEILASAYNDLRRHARQSFQFLGCLGLLQTGTAAFERVPTPAEEHGPASSGGLLRMMRAIAVQLVRTEPGGRGFSDADAGASTAYLGSKLARSWQRRLLNFGRSIGSWGTPRLRRGSLA